MTENVVWHNHSVDKTARESLNKHQSGVLWFTGLSGSGKSTIAGQLETELYKRGIHTYLLDGDNVRMGLCSDLGFTASDRQENIRRIGEVAKLMADAGLVVLSAFISPFKTERQLVREMLPEGSFIEVFIDTPLDVCESRDPKGLYKKARRGEIKHFTGIDSDYEAPEKAELHINTENKSVSDAVNEILASLHKHGIIPA